MKAITSAFVVLFITGICFASENLVTRVYLVQPSFLDTVKQAPASKSIMGGEFVPSKEQGSRFTRSQSDRLEQYFLECGVTFPEGSYIRYNERIHRLFVKNTSDNQSLVKYLLHMWGKVPKQVQLDVAWISFDKENIDKLAMASPTATPPLDEIRRLKQEGKGEIISTMTTITRSGVRTEQKSTEESIYANFSDSQERGNNDTNDLRSVRSVLEAQQAGAIINFIPTVGPDGERIDIGMVPELREKKNCQNGEAILSKSKIAQFHSQKIESSVIVRNGATLVLGGMLSEDGKEVLYIFLTASLLDDEGNPVPQYDFDL